MRTLTDRDKRTVRFASIGIAIYLALFGGFQAWKHLEKKRTDFQQLVTESQELRRKVQPYQDKVQVLQRMMDEFKLDPAKLKEETVVSDANAAIQNAANSGGLQLGPIRESLSRASGNVLTTVQLESSGPIPATLTFLAGLNRIGFPLVVNSVQLAPDNMRPGQVRMNLTINILDFAPPKEVPHA